ncbi:MAG: hypothetical protein AB8G18_15290 [Gammaproteobacteria bacterium]
MAASPSTVMAQMRPNCRALTPAPLVNEPRFVRYLETVDSIVETPQIGMARQVSDALKELIAAPDWLPAECCEPSEECYRRHLLYADPEGRYTVLALAWLHGQSSPIHGHTAWCAMGVYSGFPSAAGYTCEDGQNPVQTNVHHCSPGQVDSLEPGADKPHRVFNDSNDLVITIHTYGRDLVDEPCSINILF